MNFPSLGNFQKEEVKDWSSVEHKVIEVIDGKNGVLLGYRQALIGTRAEIFERRSSAKSSIDSDYPAYRCSYCHAPVSIASTKDKATFFFRHRPTEGATCPYENKAQLSHAEIRARHYNGAKESVLHLRMKEILRLSLQSDDLVDSVLVEKTVIGVSPGTRRKPDVQATLKDGRKLVFEVQLTTTFLDVMKERLSFYQENNSILIWVFANANIDNPKIVLEDAFYTNNRNLFVANERTLQDSLARKQLVLDCLYVTPWFDQFGDLYTSRWKENPVTLSELRSSEDISQTYWFDFAFETALAKDKWRHQLIVKLAEYWNARYNFSSNTLLQEQWAAFYEVCMRNSVELPAEPKFVTHEAFARIAGVLSAYLGRPVGFGYPKLISVAHHFFDKSCEHALLPFGLALKAYGNQSLFLAEDKSKKWEPKQKIVREKIKVHDKAYIPDISIDEWRLYEMLFPRILEALSRWCAPSKEVSIRKPWYEAPSGEYFSKSNL